MGILAIDSTHMRVNNNYRWFVLTIAMGLVALVCGGASSYAADLSIRIEDRKQVSVHDTIVELITPQDKLAGVQEVEITQLNKEFSPELSVINRGSSVLFSNKDSFQHHVYSVSRGNQFDLPLYRDTPARLIEFDSHGVVKLGCNIHDWMLGFIYVADSPHLVITDSSGEASFSQLPAGEYQLRIWNPRLRNNKKVITQTLTLAEEDRMEHSVAISLRKKIRKPPKRQHQGENEY